MKIQIDITGMSCQHCVKRVEEALKENFETSMVNVDLANNQATVDFTSEVSDQQIMDVIDDVGYEVSKINRLD